MNAWLLVLLVAFTLYGCTEAQNNSLQNDSKEIVVDKTDADFVSSELAVADGLVISENHLGEIPLPFPHQDMMGPLRKTFAQYSVTKETGQQDGPDFPLYSIMKGARELVFFEMDWEETQKLAAIYIKDGFIKDQYGLSVGDSYAMILKLRDGHVKIHSDYHERTYAYLDGSNIMYEIISDTLLPAAGPEDQTYTENHLKNWRIHNLIWRK